MNNRVIRYSDIILPVYNEFFKTDKTYVVCKGSRASGKSVAACYYILLTMMRHPLANALCVRQVASTLRDSVYSTLKWCINQLGISHLWKCTLNPLEIVYIPTGQKIFFRGCDDSMKIASIAVDTGVLNILLVEEAYQVTEEDFDMIQESLRGKLPEGYKKRIMLIFNPWLANWIKTRFFDVVDDDILAMTTTYKDNPYLSDTDLAMFERMKVQNPRRYEVAGLGNFGVMSGQIFDNWEVQDLTDLIPTFDNVYWGLDFGVVDVNALVGIHVDMGQRKIYVFDEFYKGNLSLDELSEEVSKRIDNHYVTCDSAGAQNILELNNRGIWALPSIKGKDSILHGIQFILDFDVIIHKDCKNFIKEISNYQWDTDKQGNSVNRPVDRDNHLMDAIRYALEPLMHQSKMESTKRLM